MDCLLSLGEFSHLGRQSHGNKTQATGIPYNIFIKPTPRRSSTMKQCDSYHSVSLLQVGGYKHLPLPLPQVEKIELEFE